MILQAFAKSYHKIAADIPPIILLNRWLRDILKNIPESNVEKIIHTELSLFEDEKGLYVIMGKNYRGQKLLQNLYNFVESLEHQDFSRWLHEKNTEDFNRD